MPRQPRLQAPGAVQHGIGWGSERTQLCATDGDREEFLGRGADGCRARALLVDAWASMPYHVHLLVRTGGTPLPQSMKKLLTGYVVNFNRRHQRYGYLFPNRYTSMVVEEEPDRLEVVRYLPLNPVRA